jgi:multidrug efflux pump
MLNVLLELAFLVGLGLGMAGAAIAGALSSLGACLLGFFFLSRRSSGFHLQRGYRLSGLRAIVRTGSPAALNNFLSAIRLICLNAILLATAISFFAVANSMSELGLCLISGIPQTAAPMIGVYWGERDNRSIRLLLRRQVITGVALASAYAAALAVFPTVGTVDAHSGAGGRALDFRRQAASVPAVAAG